MNCLEHVFFKPRPRPSGLRRSDPDRDLTLFFPVQVSVTFHYYSDGHVAGLQRTAKSSHRHSHHVIPQSYSNRQPPSPHRSPPELLPFTSGKVLEWYPLRVKRKIAVSVIACIGGLIVLIIMASKWPHECIGGGVNVLKISYRTHVFRLVNST